MSLYVRVEDPDAEKFMVHETHPADPDAPPGQHLHPTDPAQQVVEADKLKALEDALDEDGRLKVGWYDEVKYLGRDRPDQ